MTTTVKTCFKCLRTLDISEFYRHGEMKDGRFWKCKECTRADVVANRLEKIEHYRSFDKLRASAPHRIKARKEYAKTEQGIAMHKAANARWTAKHPERKAAHSAVQKALKSGRITKAPCFVCGASEVEGHHYDYSTPLSVTWLCVDHHKEIHWQMDKAS